jgi:DNA-directed RNA polymerase subunit RPC12/RpoP
MNYYLCPRCHFKVSATKYICSTCGFKVPPANDTKNRAVAENESKASVKPNLFLRLFGSNGATQNQKETAAEKPALS